MRDIAAIVTIATATELTLVAHWPLRWWQAPGAKSFEIQRKLLPNETLLWPQEPVIEEEISGDRGEWHDLKVGDRVIVRLFWPWEKSRWFVLKRKAKGPPAFKHNPRKVERQSGLRLDVPLSNELQNLRTTAEILARQVTGG
jgi:hypothetical protein